MTCRRARALLPLAAGNDLPSGRDKRLQAHIRRCPDCRQELERYRKALEEMKSLARTEALSDWSESEWREIVRRSSSQRLGKRDRFFPGSRRLAWTLGQSFLVLLLAAGIFLLFRGGNEKKIPPFPAKTPAEMLEVKERAPQPNLEQGLRQPAPSSKIGPQQPPEIKGTPARPAIQAQAPQKQNVTQMVFVSSESGLTIHWVFNSEFEWKEK